MATSNLSISLPDSMRDFVEQKIERGSYGTISEYLRELIRADERREAEYYDRLIAEAYASGPIVPHTKDDIESAKKEVLRRIKAGKRHK
jgi:antitoxin ParD1/3/4